MSQRDVLLATKLRVPSRRPAVVPRPPLAARLEEGRARGLVLVCAPAGYGKTVTALAAALALACPQGYVRVFADEGAPMAALLGTLIAVQRTAVPAGYLARLQRALGQPAEPGCPQPGLIDPLTSRELEVLRLLAAGKPNQAIARELVITLDTVKKHVGHVLGKLGAANRTEAVARAHELDLLT
jgi:LuxR family maltose regulon positive regulatory protein